MERKLETGFCDIKNITTNTGGDEMIKGVGVCELQLNIFESTAIVKRSHRRSCHREVCAKISKITELVREFSDPLDECLSPEL